MYTEASIDLLETLVGWARPIPPAVIELTGDNLKADSFLTVSSFHKLATVENLYACIANEKVNMEGFNDFLKTLRRQAVTKVLNAVLVNNTSKGFLYNAAGKIVDRTIQDFDPTIESRSALFANAIGYQLAVDAIEVLIVTPRSNGLERNASLAYELLKIELEGADDTSNGLMGRMYGARKSLSGILFPEYINSNKPINRFVRPW